RVINTHSVETLPKRKLDIRIGHRFGDLAGSRGGWKTFYGLENAEDVMIGGEYGITNALTIGINRTKASGPLKRLVNGIIKYKLLRQKEDNSMPFTVTLLSVTSASTMEKSPDPEVINYFNSFSHRFIYTGQLLIARKFSNNFSLQVIPSYTHRNVVGSDDENGLISLGFASRIQLSKVFGIIVDGTFPFSDLRIADNGYYPAIGIGLEIDTGGHLFQLNFTNATAISETDYIPNTFSNWNDGEFRLGFTVSRTFNL
ncbi:MAG: hypothetical protein ACI81W_001399, partial [Saprospiraceae bacterium]